MIHISRIAGMRQRTSEVFHARIHLASDYP